MTIQQQAQEEFPSLTDKQATEIAEFEKACEAEYWRAQALIAEMRAAVQEVPVYAERYRSS